MTAKNGWIDQPGRTIDGLHVFETGSGHPVVVLEAGIAASSVSWSLVQRQVAAFTRVASYDRAGFGWSGEGSNVRPDDGTALAAAERLARMVREAGWGNRLVFVGHSFGGLIVRILAQRHPELVGGLVLVDPVLRAEWRSPEAQKLRMLGRGVRLSRRGAVLARLGVVRVALRLLLSGSRRVPQLMARMSAGSGSQVTNRLAGEVGKMPREHWPAIAQHWSEPRSFRAMASNLEKLPQSAGQLDETADLGDLPIVVLSAGKHVAEHAHDASLSTRGEYRVIENCGHWMQLDQPGAVVEAIRRVVEEVRAR